MTQEHPQEKQLGFKDAVVCALLVFCLVYVFSGKNEHATDLGEKEPVAVTKADSTALQFTAGNITVFDKLAAFRQQRQKTKAIEEGMTFPEVFMFISLLGMGIGVFIWWRGEKTKQERAEMEEMIKWQSQPLNILHWNQLITDPQTGEERMETAAEVLRRVNRDKKKLEKYGNPHNIKVEAVYYRDAGRVAETPTEFAVYVGRKAEKFIDRGLRKSKAKASSPEQYINETLSIRPK